MAALVGAVAEGILLVELGHATLPGRALCMRGLLAGAGPRESGARRGDKGPDLADVLDVPARSRRPRTRRRRAAPVTAIASRDIAGVEPARQQPGLAADRARRAAASRRRRHCRRDGARLWAPWRRTAGDRRYRVGLRGGEIAGGADADRLDRRQAEQALEIGDARRRLAAMQLQEIGRDGVDNGAQSLVRGIDRQHDDPRAPVDARGQRLRLIERQMARALLEKHEADHVGARVKRGVERRRGREAADFDQSGHGAPFRQSAPLVKGSGGVSV